MKKVLEDIDRPRDLKRLSLEELKTLAEEVRRLIVEVTSEVGGHLASSLGAVELAIAIHYAFDAPEDRIVWDVGHQAYAHKILTGRRAEFHTLRQSGGISGFPKPSESVFDAFGVGHSSTSISAALGMAVARDLKGGRNRVVAVIGDGALTAGLAFEGLNQAGHLKRDLVVVVNDNEMSISHNVGALSSFLSRKITGRFIMKLKAEVEVFMKSIPMIGGRLVNIAKRAEDSLITLLTPGMIFEGLGFHYIGPIDGHDLESLITTFKDINGATGPVLVHVLTKKGKGYKPAEEDPSRFHGVSPFYIDTGREKKEPRPTCTSVFSSALVELADTDPRVVAITAAMPEGTGLNVFARKYPDRFFDVGIAEPHALTFAAGLAKEGFIPVAAIYSTFLQRAYDEIFHDVCLHNLPVFIAMDRAGIVGADGPTHHGLFDISYLRHLPNMVVMAPRDEGELRDMLYSGIRYGRPVAMRYPRGACAGVSPTGPMKEIPLGRAEVLAEGADAAVLAIGSTVHPALEAVRRLEKQGIKAALVNSRFVKPLDDECILNAAASTGMIVTVEEGALQGGFGSAVLELLEERGVRCQVKRIGVPDEVVEHGTQEELRKKLGLDALGIEKTIRTFLLKKQGKVIRGNFL